MEQRLCLLHACKNAPAFDIYDNGTLLISKLRLYEHSEYISIFPGTHKITVYVAGTSRNPIISKLFRIFPGTSTTITVDGCVQTISMHKFKMPEEKYFLNRSLVRCANLTDQSSTIILDGKRNLFQHVPAQKSTAYKSIFCGEHNFSSNTLELSAQTEINKSYTIYVLEDKLIFIPQP